MRFSLIGLLLLSASAASAAATAHHGKHHSKAQAEPLAANEELLDHGRFKNLHLYHPAGTPKSVALLLSGDGRWNPHEEVLAQTLVAQGALVVGIDTPPLIKAFEADGSDCVYPDGDLENLSHYVQAYAKLPGYRAPLLVGFSSGATLAYGTLAQAPRGTFAAGLVLGFCPDLEMKKPLCRGEGATFIKRSDGRFVDFLPAPKLAVPFVALLGEQDAVCDATGVANFIALIPAARQVMLKHTGHDYGSSPAALAAFAAAYKKLAASAAAPVVPPAPADLGDLPVIEEPASSGSSDYVAIFWSGDGGWAGLDKEVAQALRAKGIPVVGVDSLRYFWSARTPDGIAADVEKIIGHYTAAWHKSKVLLLGYSQGADVLPFVLTRLSAATRAKVALAGTMGLSDHAAFEFHLSNWVGDDNSGPETLPEIARIKGMPFLCIYGKDDEDAICGKLRGTASATVVELPGGHHFDGAYEKVADTILAALPAKAKPAAP